MLAPLPVSLILFARFYDRLHRELEQTETNRELYGIVRRFATVLPRAVSRTGSIVRVISDNPIYVRLPRNGRAAVLSRLGCIGFIRYERLSRDGVVGGGLTRVRC